MAMIACPECKKKVSDTAGSCPNCGFALSAEKVAEIKANEERAQKAGAIGCLSIIGVLVVVFYLIGSSSTDTEPKQEMRTEFDDAFLLCKAMEGTGLTTECKVQGYDRAVDVTIDTTGAEARKICVGVAAEMTKYTANFSGQWKLRIFSPYSGNRPIATCALL